MRRPLFAGEKAFVGFAPGGFVIGEEGVVPAKRPPRIEVKRNRVGGMNGAGKCGSLNEYPEESSVSL